MTTNPILRARTLLVVATALLLLGATLSASVPAGAAAITHQTQARSSAAASGPALTSGSDYLALGDSAPFGFREAANLPAPDYTRPNTLVGYPEDVAADLAIRDTNAACPGETTASLIDSSAPSNGCETTATGGPGYRQLFPLHVAYAGSQLGYAVEFLRRHHDTALVSLMIGANDAFLCQATTADHCAGELPAILQSVAGNVATILDRLRRAGGYRGQIAIVNYYSLDYTQPATNAATIALNQTVDAAAAPFGVEIADGFAAFQGAAAQAGGQTCSAGLLTTLTTGGCGDHPSVAGHAVLAGALERTVVKP